jgi:hypothetical protein
MEIVSERLSRRRRNDLGEGAWWRHAVRFKNSCLTLFQRRYLLGEFARKFTGPPLAAGAARAAARRVEADGQTAGPPPAAHTPSQGAGSSWRPPAGQGPGPAGPGTGRGEDEEDVDSQDEARPTARRGAQTSTSPGSALIQTPTPQHERWGGARQPASHKHPAQQGTCSPGARTPPTSAHPRVRREHAHHTDNDQSARQSTP